MTATRRSGLPPSGVLGLAQKSRNPSRGSEAWPLPCGWVFLQCARSPRATSPLRRPGSPRRKEEPGKVWGKQTNKQTQNDFSIQMLYRLENTREGSQRPDAVEGTVRSSSSLSERLPFLTREGTKCCILQNATSRGNTKQQLPLPPQPQLKQ